MGVDGVENRGSTDRIHLIFDITILDQPEPEWLAQLQPSGPGLLREAPRRLGEHRHALRHFRGLRVARRAVDHALLDALDDAGEAEQIVGEIPVELVARPARRIAPNSARRSRQASECRARQDRVRRARQRRRPASSTASRDRRNRRADRRASPAPSRAPRSACRRRRTRHCRCDSRHGRSRCATAPASVSGRKAISRSISGR